MQESQSYKRLRADFVAFMRDRVKDHDWPQLSCKMELSLDRAKVANVASTLRSWPPPSSEAPKENYSGPCSASKKWNKSSNVIETRSCGAAAVRQRRWRQNSG